MRRRRARPSHLGSGGQSHIGNPRVDLGGDRRPGVTRSALPKRARGRIWTKRSLPPMRRCLRNAGFEGLEALRRSRWRRSEHRLPRDAGGPSRHNPSSERRYLGRYSGRHSLRTSCRARATSRIDLQSLYICGQLPSPAVGMHQNTSRPAWLCRAESGRRRPKLAKSDRDWPTSAKLHPALAGAGPMLTKLAKVSKLWPKLDEPWPNQNRVRPVLNKIGKYSVNVRAWNSPRNCDQFGIWERTRKTCLQVDGTLCKRQAPQNISGRAGAIASASASSEPWWRQLWSRSEPLNLCLAALP